MTKAAADQVGLVAVGVPGFAVEVKRVSPAALVSAGARVGPDLVTDPNGPAWLVSQSASAGVGERFWQVLLDPATFSR